jgi:hypothetical protein
VDPSGDGVGGLTATGPVCVSCGAQSNPTAKFCGECGARLTGRFHFDDYRIESIQVGIIEVVDTDDDYDDDRCSPHLPTCSAPLDVYAPRTLGRRCCELCSLGPGS